MVSICRYRKDKVVGEIYLIFAFLFLELFAFEIGQNKRRIQKDVVIEGTRKEECRYQLRAIWGEIPP